MDELAKLHERLHKIGTDAETVTRYGRVLEIAKGANGLSILREEVEETRFERVVLFRNDRHEELGVHVIAGRVMRLTALHLLDPKVEQIDLINEDVTADAHHHIVTLAAAITTFCQGVNILYVKAEPPPKTLRHAAIGARLDMILAPGASSVPNAPAAQVCPPLGPVRLADFMARTEEIAIASLHIADRDIASATGLEDALQPLLELAETELQFRAKEAKAGRAPNAEEHCIILTTHLENGQTVLCATLGVDLVFLTCPAGDLIEILGHWQASKKQDASAV